MNTALESSGFGVVLDAECSQVHEDYFGERSGDDSDSDTEAGSIELRELETAEVLK